MDQETFKSAKRLAIGRASRRESSSSEMQTFLEKKGFESDVISAVVSELKLGDYINDERYACLWIRSQGLRGKGPIWLLHKLKEKGIVLELEKVKKILNESMDVSEIETVRKILDRKYPNAGRDPKEARRATQMLLRNGYSYSIIREAIQSE